MADLNEMLKFLKSENLEYESECLRAQEVKSLTVLDRSRIAENIYNKFSELKNQRGVFHEQLFCAMEEYLKQCDETGYLYNGL